jgi:uncharacterized damage-inducible protein DinB
MTVVLVRELEGLQAELAMFADDETVWRTLPGVTNSAGNIALHVAGNLQHFVGAVLGGTRYVRDRDAEFDKRSGTRADVVAELARAIEGIRAVLPRLSEAMLDAPYPQPRIPVEVSTRRFLLHLCCHAAYHLGQVGYLRRMLTGDNRTSHALGMQSLER